MPLTRDDIMKIMEAYQKAAEKVGKVVKTAVLYDENGEELLIDNRKDEELN